MTDAARTRSTTDRFDKTMMQGWGSGGASWTETKVTADSDATREMPVVKPRQDGWVLPSGVISNLLGPVTVPRGGMRFRELGYTKERRWFGWEIHAKTHGDMWYLAWFFTERQANIFIQTMKHLDDLLYSRYKEQQ